MSDARVLSTNANPKHSFTKHPQPSIHLIANHGVEGDAHAGATVQHLYLKRKNPLAPNRMQVHLISSELLDELHTLGFNVAPGDLGENITTTGIDLLTLPRGSQLHIGSKAVIELTCLRTPCKQIEDFRTGLQKQMTDASRPRKQTARAGVMSIVVAGGTVMPNDTVRISLPGAPHLPLTTD